MAKLTVPINNNSNDTQVKKKVYEIKKDRNNQIQKITVEQKDLDIKNWHYDYGGIGLLNVPKWNNISLDELTFKKIYDDNNVSITIQKESISPTGEKYMVVVTTNDFVYYIDEIENDWYKAVNLNDPNPTKISLAPDIQIDTQYVISGYEDLFNAVYGQQEILVRHKIGEKSNTIAYTEITSPNGIQILTTDWVENSDNDYPYKYTLNNGYFIGASNVDVIFDIDSDTSMISTTAIIEDEDGYITIYAQEIPSDTITIEKITVFNDADAYINYSNQIVQQVLANTDAISDINNTELPQYVKKEIIRNNFRTFVNNKNYAENGNQIVDVSLQAVEVQNANTFTNCNVTATLTGAMLRTIKVENGSVEQHTLLLDVDGNLTLDGNAVGGGNVEGGNVWHTWTQANFIDGEATFSISNIVKPNDIPLSVADKVLYVDENDNIAECYMIDAIGDISVTLVKVGDFSSGGGSGGGIPVITLQASQMLSQTQIQFTQEQYNTIVNNGCFYLDLLGSQQLLMTCVNASNLADIQCYNISQTGSGLQLATIDLNKSTYIGVLGISPYPQVTQSYHHNITISGGSNYIYLTLEITNDSNVAFTYDSLKAYLNDNGFSYPYLKSVSGTIYMSNKAYALTGIYYDSNTIYISYGDAGMEFNSNIMPNNVTISDKVL